MRPDSFFSHAWQVSIGRFLVLLLVAGLAGLASGHLLLVLLAALFGYACWSLYSLYRMQQWLHSRRRAPPLDDSGVWSDITEFVYRKLRTERSRKRRLIALLRAFREAAAALPDGVIVLDRERRIQWFNESAGRLLRLAAPRDGGKPVDDFVPLAARNWLVAGPSSDPLIDVPAPHDEALRLSLRLIHYGRDQVMLVVRDITPLMRLEQMRRDFVANVSHELRTPLTVLHGYLDMIEPDEVPHWAPMLADLRGQSRRMAQIVEDLLTLSRLEAPQDAPDERVAMRPLLASLKRDAETLGQGAQEVHLHLDTDFDLRGSNQYLHSAFSNLISNAVRYTPAKGRIDIHWERADDGLRLRVVDTGYGIPAEHLPRITERFYRVSTSRSRAHGGTGLGLSIVKHALALHEARLEIESEVGRGSSFTCVFPPAAALPAAADGTPPAGPR